MRPGRKAGKHVGRAVRDHVETLAYRRATDLRCGPIRARHIERPRRRRGRCGRMRGAVMLRRGEDAPCHHGMHRQVPRLWLKRIAAD
ncbi:UNVERIFIED_CONTAM: hypothetical protein Sradi_3626600 [Sesamum radiatum]|uniref:Uncharacterized protein n=1 Tax=Sesamum radiatum TaxID=300843 RepID=A0AAW2QHY6_SESRA